MSQYVRGAALCRSIVAQQARASAGNASSQIQRRSRSSSAVLLRASWAALQQQHLQHRHRTSQQHGTSRQLQVVASSQIVLRQRQWDSTGAAYALVARHPFSSEPPGQQQPPQPHPPSSNKRWALLRPSEVEIEAINDKSESALKDLAEEYRVYREARLHPKKALKEESPPSITDMVPSTEKAKGMISRIPGMVKKGVVASAKFTWEIIRHPSQLRLRWGQLKGALREMAQHYYLGSKLLWNDMKTTQKIVSRMLTGHALTRRERKQLLRTSSDIFRMVPLAIFVIIPFMEFLLPFALKIFPNMLPSTFQDSLKKEENMKKELKMRLALAGFLQDTVQEMASRKKQAVEGKSGEDSVVALKELQEFIEKAKLGHIGNDDITRFARLFKDELTLENTSRAQLVNLCRFMGLAPYGGDNFLRFQLRSHLRAIKQDDQRILWEGVSSLTKQELQEACRERGMRATGLTKEGYRRQLGQWLDLSTAKAVPISLLIMSRAFTLEAMDPASALALSIGAMDSGVVTEVMIEAASNAERKTPEYRAIKLESLERQNELIEQEHKKRQAALAKKKLAEDEAKAKTEAAKAPVDTDAQQHDAVVSAAKAAEEAAASAPPPTAEPVLTESQVVAGDAKVGSRAVKPAPTAAAAAAAAPAQEAPKADAAAPPAAAAAAAPADAQAAAAAGDGEKPKKKREITAEELRALESLTNPSSMTKEKAQLAQMKATLSESMAAAKEEAAATAAAVAAVAQAHHAQQAAAAATQRHQQEAYGEAPPPPSDGGSSSTAAAAAPKAAAAAAAAAEPKPAQGKAPAQPSTAQEPPKDSPSEAALNVVEAAAAQVEAAKGDDSAAAVAAATVAAAAKSETDDIDKSVQRVQNKLASMLDKLEMDIETVEAKIGDKFHMLDRDRDGVVGAEELAFVIQHVLSSHSTEEEALQIVTDLDVDQDGQISVQELIDWVEKYSAAAEADEVFDDLYSMQHPRGEKRAVGGKRAARDASAKDAAAAAAAAAAADKSQS